METWRYIKGYENLYMISNLGRVRDKFNNIIKSETIWNGYKRVTLTKNGKREKLLVHRLVAITYKENPKNLETVNHIDQDKSNNCVDNLEWLSNKDNKRYSAAIKIIGECIETGEKIIFDAISDVRGRGFNTSCIYNVINGKAKQHKGYYWYKV